MSVLRARTSLLSLSPSMTQVGRGLRVRTNAVLRALSLWSYERQVHIDTESRRIFIDSRRFWLWNERRVIRFSDVAYIDYAFTSTGTSWSAGLLLRRLQRDDQLESFRISLALEGTDELVPIATFRGAGAVHNGWLGVLLGDSLIDAEGEQEDSSRELVDWLADTTGARIGRPLMGRDLHPIAVCPTCDRALTPHRGGCLYCGGAVQRL